jgi:hypothetical protein
LAVVTLLIACGPARVADLNPVEFAAGPAQPQPEGMACKMLKASACAYGDLRTNDPLQAGFCPELPGWKQGQWGAGKKSEQGFRDSAYTALYPEFVVIAFRGTLPPTTPKAGDLVYRDWKNDADATMVHLTNEQDVKALRLKTTNKTDVHKGFKEALDSVWDEIGPTIGDWKRRGLLGALPIYVTGHSKGGAVANLAAMRLQDEGYTVKEVYSYAAARPGGVEFRQRYEGLNIPTWRYENQGDLVPHLPFGPEEFDAVGWFSLHRMRRFRGSIVFYPVGKLTYIFEDGRVVAPQSLRCERCLNADRVAVFKNGLSDYVGGDESLIEALGAAHSIDPALPGEQSDVHRYYRAVCGTVPKR